MIEKYGGRSAGEEEKIAYLPNLPNYVKKVHLFTYDFLVYIKKSRTLHVFNVGPLISNLTLLLPI